MTNHFGYAPELHFSHHASYKGPDFSAGYHTFAIEWNRGSISWYVDDTLRSVSTRGLPEMPMSLLCNLAVGGSWPGAPDNTTHFPGYFDVDHIRVWQYADTQFTSMNTPPVITISGVPERSFVPWQAPCTISAAITDDHTITQVRFYNNGKELISLGAPPWRYVLSSPASGLYAIAVTAVDDSGALTVSSQRNFRVLENSGNLLINGDFEINADAWNLSSNNGAEATLTTTTNALEGKRSSRITVNSAGSAYWHIQLSQNVPLASGDSIYLSFKARSDAPRSMGVLFQKGDVPYTEYWSVYPSLTTLTSDFSYSFVSPVSDLSTLLKFLPGKHSPAVELDAIVVKVVKSKVTILTGIPAVRKGYVHTEDALFNLQGRRLTSKNPTQFGAGVLLVKGLDGQYRLSVCTYESNRVVDNLDVKNK
jgi:hypothetical protein